MLRRSVLTPTRPELLGEGDGEEALSLDVLPDWLPRRLADAPRRGRGDDEIGVRSLLSRPEAQSKAWRETTAHVRSPGRRHRRDRGRAPRVREA